MSLKSSSLAYPNNEYAMKSHDVAKQLESVAKLLRMLPDHEITDVIPAIVAIVRDHSSGKRKGVLRESPVTPQLLDRLRGLSAMEIQRLLTDSEEFDRPAVLRELAKKLGIPLSQRQSRAALVNTIASHIENQQMDLIIRSRHGASQSTSDTTQREHDRQRSHSIYERTMSTTETSDRTSDSIDARKRD